MGRISTKTGLGRRGFTLVELLTVIGIIGILMALLFPALVGARRAAQATQCASNLRQLTAALTNYSVEFKGYYPGNVGALDVYWYNRDQIGRYVRTTYGMSNSEQCINGVFVCPADLENTVRSYSMNVFASGVVSPFVSQRLIGPAAQGRLWRSNVGNASAMILLIESFSYEDWPAEHSAITPGVGATGIWASPAVVGFVPQQPGERFVSGGPDSVRFGFCDSQLSYFRHRPAKQPGGLGNAYGRLNIGFADGHVELLSEKDLFDFDSGRSTYRAMWSPNDREVEDRLFSDG